METQPDLAERLGQILRPNNDHGVSLSTQFLPVDVGVLRTHSHLEVDHEIIRWLFVSTEQSAGPLSQTKEFRVRQRLIYYYD
ncbi:hypothetical protein RvY_02946 [Ramazzottius varieornatus]|uniref:Uncharacterized protein n=1 Tax=Ramazzottius varieornatus TaxID=947166 RepID=A0A1D1UVX5_RAMVA|nr:hypothetical protein RvY_02946 [Ramazzottius varieornatus]